MSPGFQGQLAADFRLARGKDTTMSQLKRIAGRYNLSLRPGISFLLAKSKVEGHLKELGASSPVLSSSKAEEEPQGSSAARFSPSSSHKNPLFVTGGAASPLPAHRLSYSQAASPAGPKHNGSKMLVLGSVSKPQRLPLTQAAGALQEASPEEGEVLVTAELGPDSAGLSQISGLKGYLASLEQRLQQSDARAASLEQRLQQSDARAASLEQRLQQCDARAASLEQRMQQCDARAEAQAEQLARQVAELGSLHISLGNLKQAQQTCSNMALGAAQGVANLRGDVERLQGEAARTQELERHVSQVQSQQQKLTEQQQMGECQRSIIFKTPTPLAAQQSKAEAAGAELTRLLKQNITVVRVQELQRRHSGGGGGSDSSQGGSQRRSVYKCLLASSEARDAVMRSKADKLRGSPITITACLTAAQQARVQALRPAAADAKQAGKRVQWRYDRLFIDGAEYKGEARLSSQPGPSSDSSASGGRDRAQAAPAAAAPAPTQPQPNGGEEEEGEWQEVPARKGKQQQRRRQQQQQAAAKPKAGARGRKAPVSSDPASPSKQPGSTAESYAMAARRAEAAGKENRSPVGESSKAPKAARLPRPAPSKVQGTAQRSIRGSQQSSSSLPPPPPSQQQQHEEQVRERPRQRPPSPPASPTRA